MRRLLVPAVLAAVLLTACGTDTDPEADPVGTVADATPTAPSTAQATDTPDQAASVPKALKFTATTSAGDAFDAATLAGKPVVFWFWAPWCPTCRAQAPGVKRLAEEYGDQVAVVGVGSLDDESAIEDFAEDVPEITHLMDPDGAVWRHFGVTAQSTYLVLDRQGGTAASGYLDDGDLANLVAELAR